MISTIRWKASKSLKNPKSNDPYNRPHDRSNRGGHLSLRTYTMHVARQPNGRSRGKWDDEIFRDGNGCFVRSGSRSDHIPGTKPVHITVGHGANILIIGRWRLWAERVFSRQRAASWCKSNRRPTADECGRAIQVACYPRLSFSRDMVYVIPE